MVATIEPSASLQTNEQVERYLAWLRGQNADVVHLQLGTGTRFWSAIPLEDGVPFWFAARSPNANGWITFQTDFAEAHKAVVEAVSERVSPPGLGKLLVEHLCEVGA